MPPSLPEVDALRAVIDELATGKKLGEDPQQQPLVLVEKLLAEHRGLLDAVMETMQPTDRFDPMVVHLTGPGSSMGVSLFRWDKGNIVPFHDHPQVSDATHVLRGALTEQSAVRRSPIAQWDGALVKIATSRLEEGATVLRTEPQVHQVTNMGEQAVFSLHANVEDARRTTIFGVIGKDKRRKLKKFLTL